MQVCSCFCSSNPIIKLNSIYDFRFQKTKNKTTFKIAVVVTKKAAEIVMKHHRIQSLLIGKFFSFFIYIFIKHCHITFCDIQGFFSVQINIESNKSEMTNVQELNIQKKFIWMNIICKCKCFFEF